MPATRPVDQAGARLAAPGASAGPGRASGPAGASPERRDHAHRPAGDLAIVSAGSASRPRSALPVRPPMHRQPAVTALAGLALAPPTAQAIRPAPAVASLSSAESSAPAPPEARWAHLRTTTFQHWSPEDGLPHPIVTALAQDRTGFLWVGTQDGLARWDGYRFKPYQPDASDARKAGSLSSGYIDTLGTDRAGRLWVGTDDGHLARLDESTDRFVPVDAPADTASATSEIMSLVDDGGAGLWVGTSRSLWHVDESGANPDVHPKARTVTGMPSGHAVRALLRDPPGLLWVGTEQGLWQCANPPAKLRCTAFPLGLPSVQASAPKPAASAAAPMAAASASPASSAPASASAPALSISALARTKDGRLWIGTAGAGAFVLDPSSGRTMALRESGAAVSKFATDVVTTIAQAPTGELWMGTNGDGVIVVDPATLGTRHVRHDPRLAPGLSSDDVYVSLVDRSGLLWLGGARGLSRTDADAGAIVTIFGQTSREDGLSEADAPTLLTAADGRLWIGLGDHGIDVLDPMRGRVDHLDVTTASRVAGQPTKTAVASLAQAPDGTVFIGTAGGMFRTDGAGHGLTHIPWQIQGRPAVQELSVGGGKVWIGARVKGVWALDATSGPGATPVRPPGLEHLGDERIVAVRWNDVQARLWIGTPTGLVIYDPASGKV